MHKLQDAYDCDLDLGDTVQSIFGGETDPAMRMIKVVPSFVNRDFSVPPTSNLRPHHAHKRTRAVNGEHVSKRRRIEPAGNAQDDLNMARDQPLLSTENSRNGSRGAAHRPSSRARSQPRRSHTESSVFILHGVQTGEAEFASAVKQESPQPRLQPPARPVLRAEPTPVERHDISRRQSIRAPSDTLHTRGAAVLYPRHEIESTGAFDDRIKQVLDQPRNASVPVDVEPAPERDLPEMAAKPSPQPIRQQTSSGPQHATAKRKDVYDVPSSPELSPREKLRTARSLNSTTNAVRKEINLLNGSRLSSSQGRPGSNDPVSAFLKDIAQPKPSDVQTPFKASSLKHAKPGSLKRPTRVSLPVSKSSPSSSQADREKQIDSRIHDRLGMVKQLHSQRSPSNVVQGTNRAAPWNAESWGFDSLRQPNGTAKEANGEDEAEAFIDTQANCALQEDDGEDKDESNVESLADGTLQESDGKQEAEPQIETREDNLLDTAVEEADESQSRSVSAAMSTRSSPVVSRRPARFLSRSPTPQGSVSDDESEAPSAPPSIPTSAQPVVQEEAASEADLSHESSDSSSEDEENEEEEKEPEDLTASLPPPPAIEVVQSSPPNSASASSIPDPRSISSQPIIRQTPIPLPPNVSSQFRSSQSVSVEAAARRPAPRPTTRYSGFRSLREQLADVKSPSTTAPKTAYDPRVATLSKSMGKGKAGVVQGGENDDESSEEDSSDSSDSD
jgi:hypothetical protein